MKLLDDVAEDNLFKDEEEDLSSPEPLVIIDSTIKDEEETDPKKLLTIIYKVPQEKIPNITCTYSEKDIYALTVGQLKQEIYKKHPFKPSITNQKLLFGGKVLANNDKLCKVVGAPDIEFIGKESNILGSTKTFHLMILQKYVDMKE